MPGSGSVSESDQLSRRKILELFTALNRELAQAEVQGEVHLVGGAVMCLAYNARPSTEDVDGLFRPTAELRRAATLVAQSEGISPKWLNGAVKGWLSGTGDFTPFLQLSHLQVFVAQPEYLLATKCAAMRLGEGSHDLDDVRFLLRYLNISSMAEALAIVTRYFDESDLPIKTRLALEELLPG